VSEGLSGAATYLRGKVFLLDGDTIELNEDRITMRLNGGKPMRQPKLTVPAEKMASILFAALKRHSNLNAYVDNRTERRPFSDVILHGHFDLTAIAADLVKEVSPI
jgi:hypothetical protein